MAEAIILRYKREDGGELSTGRVSVCTPGHEEICTVFEKISFAQMIARFAEALCEYPEAEAVIERNDRAGLRPWALSKDLTELLRTDPVSAIRSMSYQPPVAQKKIKSPLSVPVPSGILAGYDAAAEAFGDYLYCRTRDGAETECPTCGRWAAIYGKDDPHVNTHIFCTPCVEKGRPFNALIEVIPASRWVRVRTEDLLQLPYDSFFLPRRWNKGRNWISRREIKQLYDQYRKDRESA